MSNLNSATKYKIIGIASVKNNTRRITIELNHYLIENKVKSYLFLNPKETIGFKKGDTIVYIALSDKWYSLKELNPVKITYEEKKKPILGTYDK